MEVRGRMMEKRNSAVVAGLAGGAVLTVPNVALALEVGEAIDSAFSSASSAFVVGALGGALVAGSAVGLVALASSRATHASVGRHDASYVQKLKDAQPEEEEPKEVPEESPAAEASGIASPGHMRQARHLASDAASEGPSASNDTPRMEESSREPSRVASHAATDYEDIAEKYVHRDSLRSRMTARAQGVAETLLARMNMDEDVMDGVPIIERGARLTEDLGENWWEDAVSVDAMLEDGSVSYYAREAAFPSNEEQISPAAESLVEDPLSVPVLSRQTPAERAKSIAQRIAFIDEGAYPLSQDARELRDGDDWDAALRSMDENIAAQTIVGFVDSVGRAETLDEPDNLEPSTSFIPFKPVAGHPEVVDRKTYVDYLIRDEFSKNSSDAARRSSRRYLLMLEGGNTQASARVTDTGSVYEGRHFAPLEAKEA